MKPPNFFIANGATARSHRRDLRLNQQQYWSKLGVTQSGGSRYESGREIPEPVLLLLHIAYAPEKSAQNLVNLLRGKKVEQQG
jgi:hypothetical protein